MTEKELQKAFAEKFELSEQESKDMIDYLIDTVVTKSFEDGKCVFGKVGTFKSVDVAAKPARIGVKNPLTGGTYDVAAKPARKKLTFSLSKFGKTLGE